MQFDKPEKDLVEELIKIVQRLLLEMLGFEPTPQQVLEHVRYVSAHLEGVRDNIVTSLLFAIGRLQLALRSQSSINMEPEDERGN